MNIAPSTSECPAQSVSGSLRDRFWTALGLALVTTAGVLWLPTPALGVALLPVFALSIWELSLLLGLRRTVERVSYLGAMLTVFALCGWLVPVSRYAWLFGPVVGYWLLLAPVVFRTRAVGEAAGVDYWLLLVSFPVLVASWLGILLLHGAAGAGPGWVLFVFMLVWLTDSGAYFAGRRFGRRKLAPVISPGKTVEGVVGGILAAALWSIALWPLTAGQGCWWLFLLCLLTALLSVVGDLSESWLKRRRRLKDAGSLLPGHGGMLDRVDSLVVAIPIFALGFLLWEKTS